jgi:hypothetical protein
VGAVSLSKPEDTQVKGGKHVTRTGVGLSRRAAVLSEELNSWNTFLF